MRCIFDASRKVIKNFDSKLKVTGQAWETWAQYGGAPQSSVTVRFPWL